MGDYKEKEEGIVRLNLKMDLSDPDLKYLKEFLYFLGRKKSEYFFALIQAHLKSLGISNEANLDKKKTEIIYNDAIIKNMQQYGNLPPMQYGFMNAGQQWMIPNYGGQIPVTMGQQFVMPGYSGQFSPVESKPSGTTTAIHQNDHKSQYDIKEDDIDLDEKDEFENDEDDEDLLNDNLFDIMNTF